MYCKNHYSVYHRHLVRYLRKLGFLECLLNWHPDLSDKIIWFSGRNYIDAVWMSDYIEISEWGMSPIVFDIDDHGVIFLEIWIQYIIGDCLLNITHTKWQRLQIWIIKIRNWYNNWYEGHMIWHQLIPWLHQIFSTINFPFSLAKRELNKQKN